MITNGLGFSCFEHTSMAYQGPYRGDQEGQQAKCAFSGPRNEERSMWQHTRAPFSESS